MPRSMDLPRPNAATLLQHYRLAADGVPYGDIEAAASVVTDPDDWFPFWSALADRYEALGTEALAAARQRSAGDWLWHASLSAHYAQALLFFDPPNREAGQRRKVELYRQAAPLINHPAKRHDIDFDPAPIPAYLRLPSGSAPAAGWPCTVLIGGGESTKEESRRFEELLLDRGVATFAFDGPGQGEVWFSVKARHDFEIWTSRVLGHLIEAVKEVDGHRIGVLGRSMGGHYALRSAATDDRLRACVAWGGFFDGEYTRDLNAFDQWSDLYVAGLPWEDREASLNTFSRLLDLSDVTGSLRCPTVVHQGGKDKFWDASHVERIAAGFPDAEIVVEPEGLHCCHNMAAIVRPQLADWLVGKLT